MLKEAKEQQIGCLGHRRPGGASFASVVVILLQARYSLVTSNIMECYSSRGSHGALVVRFDW